MDDSRVSKTNRRPRDRLSELPDSLTLEILSLLEMKDAVRTTILSKRWRDLWTTVPCLDFRAANRSFIDGALAKWKGTKILKVAIALEDDSPLIIDAFHIIGPWLRVQIQNQAEEVYLDFGCYARNDYQRFQAYVKWDQLRSLNIGGACYVSENHMNELLSCAPGLEELVLNLFDPCEKLKIRSTSLKMLHIGKLDFGDIELVLNPVQMIETPNLLTLEITPTFYYKDEDCLLDVPSLTNAILHFRGSDGYLDLQHFRHVFRSICHVEKVTLSAFCMEFLVYLKMKDMVVRFSNAKFLELVACGEARKVLHALEMFPNLMALKVTLHQGQDLERSSIGEDLDEVLVKLTWPRPSLLLLKTVELTFLGYETPIFPLIEILLEKAHMLEKMAVRLGRGFTNPEYYTLVEEKVLGMRRSSPTAVVKISKA